MYDYNNSLYFLIFCMAQTYPEKFSEQLKAPDPKPLAYWK